MVRLQIINNTPNEFKIRKKKRFNIYMQRNKNNNENMNNMNFCDSCIESMPFIQF